MQGGPKRWRSVVAGCVLVTVLAAPGAAHASTPDLELLASLDRPLASVSNGDGPQTAFSSPAIADLDGDGTLDIVAPSYDHSVCAWSTTGRRGWARWAVALLGDERSRVAALGDHTKGMP